MGDKARTTVRIDSELKEWTEEILKEDYDGRSMTEHIELLMELFKREYVTEEAYSASASKLAKNIDPFVGAIAELTVAHGVDVDEYDNLNIPDGGGDDDHVSEEEIDDHSP